MKPDARTDFVDRFREIRILSFVRNAVIRRTKGSDMEHIVIIGAGQAGATVAMRVRELGHAGRVTIIGDEPALPYERPPLSKAYLLGKIDRERLFLRPAAFYRQHRIDVITGRRVKSIDPATRQIRIEHEALAYDGLVLATGARPIQLPTSIGGDLGGIHTIRSLADVERLRGECRAGAHALVVGGGYIGLEAAAVFRGLGMRVTLLEQAPRILQRVAAERTSDYFRTLHQTHGVDIRENSALLRFEAKDGRVGAAVLGNGEVLDIDLAVVGIGVHANDDLARTAGLEVDGGIVVDAMGHSSDTSIWAAGDCTVLPWRGKTVRLQSVQNAIDQANAVAAAIMGTGEPYIPAPWFWSDQYDVKLQIAGLNTGHDRVFVRSGSRHSSVSHWYFRGEELLAVDAINDPRSFMCGKRLLECGIHPDAVRLADPSQDLKALLPA